MGKEVEITVNVNGIEVVGTRNVEEAPIKKGEEVNVFIHRAFTYGADGIVNIVENANKFEDWMVIQYIQNGEKLINMLFSIL